MNLEKPFRVGIVGCGNIAGIYLQNLARFEGLEAAALADLDPTRSEALAREYPGPRPMHLEQMLDDPGIDAVLNLTPPAAHDPVTRQALEAGKHVYTEKPLAVDLEAGRQLAAQAESAGLLLAGAPDTFLGAGYQTARRLLDEGAIGDPVGATAFFNCPGHESWHPDPEFYYARGGGPLFDMGPYYLTALVSLLGPVRAVSGSARVVPVPRSVGSGPKAGKPIEVEVSTYVLGLLEFRSGLRASIQASFDVCATRLPFVEIYGTRGSLSLPDPNGFGGTIWLFRRETGVWEEAPLLPHYRDNARGLGLADLAAAARQGRPARCSGEQILHVLELMQGILDAADAGRCVQIHSHPVRPRPLDEDHREWTLPED